MTRSLQPFTKFLRRYHYPDGYLFHENGSGGDRPTRADYTTALFSTVYDEG